MGIASALRFWRGQNWKHTRDRSFRATAYIPVTRNRVRNAVGIPGRYLECSCSGKTFRLQSTCKAFLTRCQTWDLFEGKHLFHHLLNKDGIYDPFKHMAQIVGFIGPPPAEFVRRSETATQCFNTEGTLACSARAKRCARSETMQIDCLRGIRKLGR